jgi:hypothetical protein
MRQVGIQVGIQVGHPSRHHCCGQSWTHRQSDGVRPLGINLIFVAMARIGTGLPAARYRTASTSAAQLPNLVVAVIIVNR